MLFESLPTSLNGWITGWWLDNWMPYIPPPTRYVAKASAQLCNSQPRNSLEWNSGGTDVQIDFYWNVKVYDLKWCSTCFIIFFQKSKQQTTNSWHWATPNLKFAFIFFSISFPIFLQNPWATPVNLGAHNLEEARHHHGPHSSSSPRVQTNLAMSSPIWWIQMPFAAIPWMDMNGRTM